MTRIIETDEAGDLVLSPDLLTEMLGKAPAHTRYVVEKQGDVIFVRPETENDQHEDDPSKPSHEQWERQWRITQHQVSQSWPAGVSAVEVVSEMRR